MIRPPYFNKMSSIMYEQVVERLTAWSVEHGLFTAYIYMVLHIVKFFPSRLTITAVAYFNQSSIHNKINEIANPAKLS